MPSYSWDDGERRNIRPRLPGEASSHYLARKFRVSDAHAGAGSS